MIASKSLDYKINVDIPYFYGGMHAEELIDWISQVESFFEYMEVPQGKRIELMAFNLFFIFGGGGRQEVFAQ